MVPLPTTPEQIVTIDDVAKRLHMTPRQVGNAMTKGDPAKRLGYYLLAGRRVTSEAMMASYLAANLVNPPRILPRTSILENDVRERAFRLLEELVRTGQVHVSDRPCMVRLQPPREEHTNAA